MELHGPCFAQKTKINVVNVKLSKVALSKPLGQKLRFNIFLKLLEEIKYDSNYLNKVLEDSKLIFLS